MTTVRPATADDAEAILAIYTPIVLETPISFETEPPSIAEMGQRITANSASHAYIVAERDGALLGYAYASAFRPRAAYARSCEVTAYVAADARGQGVGRRLYETLLPTLHGRGFHTAIAVITLPNDGSVALHEAFGFTKVGVLPEVGRKFDRWHDTGWWSRSLETIHP